MMDLCEACGRHGIFRVEQNGRPQRLLCERCTEVIIGELDPIAARFFDNWLPVRNPAPTRPGYLPDDTRCPSCGTTYFEFEEHGLLGCGECYQAFREAVIPALEILHTDGGAYSAS